MTKRGIAYIGLLALTLFVAFASGASEIFWVTLFLALLLVLSALSVLLAAVSISCREKLATRSVKRMDEASIDITLTGFLVFPALLDFGIMAPKSRINGSLKFSIRKATMTRLSLPLGFFRETFSLEMVCNHRGEWATIPHRARVYDAFGLFCLPILRPHAVKDPEEALRVYPQIPSLEAAAQVPKFTTDSTSTRISVADFGDSYAGIRAYRPGDTMKRIHWVQTARTRELQTRQYEISSEPYVLVLIDTGTHTSKIDPFADIATEAAAALIQMYVTGGQFVRLMIVGNPAAGDTVDMTIGDMDEFEEAYDYLMAVSFAKTPGALDIDSLRIGNAGQLQAAYFISDRYSNDIFSRLNDLAINRCDTAYVMPLPNRKEETIPNVDGMMVKLVTVPSPEEISERLGGGFN